MPCNTNMNISQEVTMAFFFFFFPLAYFLRNYSEKKFFYSGQHNICAAKMGLSLSERQPKETARAASGARIFPHITSSYSNNFPSATEGFFYFRFQSEARTPPPCRAALLRKEEKQTKKKPNKKTKGKENLLFSTAHCLG